MVALGELIRVSWGSDQPGFRQVYDARFLPDGPLDMWRAFDELNAAPPRQRTHTSSGAPSATSTPARQPAALTYRL